MVGLTRGKEFGRVKNRLLRALPHRDFQRLLPHLETMPISRRQLFYKHGDPIEYVYFPNGGVISTTTMLADGIGVATDSVCREGMLGIEAFLVSKPTALGHSSMRCRM